MNRSQRRREAQQAKKNTGQAEHSDEESCGSKIQAPLISKVMPTRSRNTKAQCKPDQTPWYKAAIEVGAFAIGLCAVLVYKGQWEAARTANDISADNSYKQTRPWVGPNIDPEAFPINIPKPGNVLTWSFPLKNFGGSPALHMKWAVGAASLVGDERVISNWSFVPSREDALPLGDVAESNLFNGQVSRISGEMDYVLPQSHLQAIENGSEVLMLLGLIQYGDQFRDTQHITAFCIRYVARPSPEIKGGWAICPTPDRAT